MANDVTQVRAQEAPQMVVDGQNAVSFSGADNMTPPAAPEARSTQADGLEPQIPEALQTQDDGVRRASSGRRMAFQFIPVPGQQQAVPVETIETQQRALEVMPAQEAEISREMLDKQLTADLQTLQQQVEQDVTRQRETEQLIGNIMTTLGQKGQFSAQLAEQFGVGDLEAQLAEVGAQIRAQAKLGPASLLKAEQDVIGSGVTTAMLSNRLSNRQRDNAIKQLVLGAEQDSIQGRLGAANARIERAVEAKFAPLETALQIQKFNLARLDQAVQRGDVRLSAKEKQQFQTRLSLIEKQENDIKEAQALQAQILKNQPSAAVRDAVLNASSVDEILKVPGIQTYMISQKQRMANARAAQSFNQSMQSATANLTPKQREKLLSNRTAQQAMSRVGVINAVKDYKNRLRNYKGGNFDFNRLTRSEKAELKTMLETTIGSAINVAQGQGAMGIEEAERIMGNLQPRRIRRTSRITSAADGVIQGQDSLLRNELSFLDSTIPGSSDALDIFSDYKLSTMSDEELFGGDLIYTDPGLSNDIYFDF